MGSSIGNSIASVIAQPSSGAAAFDTSASPQDTTGANFIFVGLGGYYGAMPATLTDSKGNTYTQVLSPQSPNNADGATMGWVCFNPTVGSGHYWSITSSGTYGTLIVDARAGVNSGTVTGSQYDGSASSSSVSFSLTPPDNGSLVYVLSSDSGHATAPSVSGGGLSLIKSADGINSIAYSGALYGVVQGAAAAVSATGTQVAPGGGYIFSFKPSSYSGGAQNITLTAAYGIFTETGEAANLKCSRILSASYGTFSETGEAATLKCGRVVTGAYGAFSLTGEAVNFHRGYVLAATYGSFTETGNTATLKKSAVVSASAAHFVLAGQPAYFSGLLPNIFLPVFAPIVRSEPIVSAPMSTGSVSVSGAMSKQQQVFAPMRKSQLSYSGAMASTAIQVQGAFV